MISFLIWIENVEFSICSEKKLLTTTLNVIRTISIQMIFIIIDRIIRHFDITRAKLLQFSVARVRFAVMVSLTRSEIKYHYRLRFDENIIRKRISIFICLYSCVRIFNQPLLINNTMPIHLSIQISCETYVHYISKAL